MPNLEEAAIIVVLIRIREEGHGGPAETDHTKAGGRIPGKLFDL